MVILLSTMNRRDFLKALGMSGAALAVPKFSYAQNKLQYPLVSVPDLDTRLDDQLASKARKVAEYVITKGNQKGLLSYNPNHRIGNDYQGVQAVMTIDGQRYTIWIANHDEQGQLKLPDMMSVWIRPEGSTRQSQLTTFSDTGLDGRCDFGIIPRTVSGTGQDILYRAKEKNNPNGEGLQHSGRFQKLYAETLDKLIQFYERK